jgi:hypothetical protein
MGVLQDMIPEWDMAVVERILEGRGRMEYEAALSNNEQEVFEKLPVISLTLGLGVRENAGAR